MLLYGCALFLDPILELVDFGGVSIFLESNRWYSISNFLYLLPPIDAIGFNRWQRCVYGHHFQQPGMVANPAGGQVNNDKGNRLQLEIENHDTLYTYSRLSVVSLRLLKVIGYLKNMTFHHTTPDFDELS